MSELDIVNPVALAEADDRSAPRLPPAPRLSSLQGARIGLYWNGKPQGDVALAHTRERLRNAVPEATFLEVFGEKGGLNRFLSPEQVDLLVEQCDAVIGTSGD